ncbi:TonB-dependent receptor domain-containing protein [Frigidibacter oleivorans]|uniref:TonB-dependent receptor domain-containing protein n=1 Tax=Frigidibacter oleivorans TaxID=2487129 RepID=UPI0013DF3E60|nr:TonB-dependent receptor [Frigidibacter oleivorans]
MPSRPNFRRVALATGTGLPLLMLSGLVAHAQTEADPYQLDEIVITATGRDQQIADAPATITVITSEQIEGRAYTNVTDILQDTPGISIENGGKLNAPSVTIRGMTENYVLFLVDGRPLGDTQDAFYNGWGGGQKTSLLPPPSAIERIEVIRGPMSSLYGSAASGGVINVITKKVGDVWTGSITADATVPESSDAKTGTQGRFYVSGPLVRDRLGLTVFGSAYDRDSDEVEGGSPETHRDSLGLRLDWRIDAAQDLTFDANIVTQDYKDYAELTGEAGDVESEELRFGLTHVLRWGAGHETTSFLTQERLEVENGDLVSAYEMLNFNTKTAMTFGDHNVVAGLDWRNETTEHDEARFTGSVATDLERWQYAVFAEDEWWITDRFALTLGGRYDENENYGSHFTPRVYGVFHLNDQLTLKGGVSAGYKVPALKQADDNIVEPAGRGAGWDQGNTDLQPEESTNYEMGLVWNAPRAIQLGLVAYHTRFENKIDREYVCETPDGSPPSCTYNGETREWIRQYVNRDAAELNGVELTFDMPLGPVDISANYTWQDSEITSGAGEGEPLNDLPEHMANLRLDWEATDRLDVWGSARYKSETVQDEDATPGYTLVDMGVEYEFTDRLQGFAGVYNVFDKTIDSDTYGKVLDGRRLHLGMTSTF